MSFVAAAALKAAKVGAAKSPKKSYWGKKIGDKKDAGKSKQHRSAISTLWSQQSGRSKTVTKQKSKRSSALQALWSRQYKGKKSSEKGTVSARTAVKKQPVKRLAGGLAKRARGGFGSRVFRRAARARRKSIRRT